jgi:RNA polymerase sigma-70 factor (ECF subfamily)
MVKNQRGFKDIQLNFLTGTFSAGRCHFREEQLDAEELFDKYSNMVYNLALRLSGNSADAQDIAQDAFIKAIRGLGGLCDEASAEAWLYRITMNVWKNRVRSEKRRFFWKTFSLDCGKDGEEDRPALQIKSPEMPVDEAMVKEDEKKSLEKALSQIDPQDRAILVLREINGRSYQEIAEIIGIALGTVKSRISRAREALRQKMGALLNRYGS